MKTSSKQIKCIASNDKKEIVVEFLRSPKGGLDALLFIGGKGMVERTHVGSWNSDLSRLISGNNLRSLLKSIPAFQSLAFSH